MVENNAEGELTGYTPGREIKMVRNPNWDAESDCPARVRGHDRGPGRVQRHGLGGAEGARAARRRSAATSSRRRASLKEAATEAEPGQLTLTPSGGNRYIGLNTQEPPFDDINVRKAVIANSDREALRNTRGGELIGPVATHHPAAAVPGLRGGRWSSRAIRRSTSSPTPTGDPELAAEYMKEAGFESGKCEGAECKITMVGDDVSPARTRPRCSGASSRSSASTSTFRPVDHDIMYTRFCSIPEQQPEVCPNVGWLKDFYDAQSMIQITFSGDAIDPENNSNWAQLDVPEINQAIDEATLINDPEERAQAWGEIDTADHGRGARGPVGLGQPAQCQVRRRRRRDQPVQRELGPLLHVAVGLRRPLTS